VRDGAQEDKRQGPLAVLALLVGILLAYSPAAAAAGHGAGGAMRLAEPELAKPAAILRGTGRAETEDQDDDAVPLVRSAEAVTATILLYTSSAARASHSLSARARPTPSYRARAPPAA